MLIMIIEDDESIRDMLGECLTDEGYQVLSARHGQDALAQLRGGGQLPDLILLDLAMPIMNGWEFLEVQRADAWLARIPVVVLSADRSLQSNPVPGSSAALAKPIDVDVLLDLVASYDN